MTRFARALVLVCCVVALVVDAAPSRALWTGGGNGGGFAAVGDLDGPGAPTVSVTNGTVTLTWLRADAGGAGPITYWVQRSPDGDISWVDACGTSAASPTSALTCTDVPGLGTFDWRVTALLATWTGIGDVSAPTPVGAVDSVAPTVALTSPSTGAALHDSVTVAANASDAQSGVASVLLQYSPGASTAWFDIGGAVTAAPYRTTWDTNGVADGSYRVRAIATDAAGNPATSTTVTVAVDNADPTIVVSPIATTGTIATGTPTSFFFNATTGGSLNLTATVTDGGSGPASATFAAPTTTGWTGTAQTVTMPAGGPYTSAAYAWTADAATIPSLTIVAADVAGNTTPVSVTFTADSTGPTGAVTAPVSGATVRGNVTLATAPADVDSGTASARFQVDESGRGMWTDVGTIATGAPWTTVWSSPMVSADYDLRVVLTDRVGNVTTSAATAGVHVDNIAPAVDLALDTGAVGAVLNDDTLVFRSSVAGSLRLVATAGGASPASSVDFPDVAATGWVHPSQRVTTPPAGPFTSSTFTWAAGATTPGSYTAVANDTAGNTATSSVTFLADNTGPTVAVTAPVAGAALRGTTTLTAGSTDAGAGVASVRFERALTGTSTWTPIATATTTPYTSVWDTTTVTDATYDLRAVATDLLGNTTTSAIVSGVVADNAAPTGSITAPPNAANLRGTVAVTTDSADTGGGVASVVVQRAPTGTTSWTTIGTDTTSPYSVSWVTTAGTADGLYDVRAVTTDRAGSPTTSATITVRVDNTLPTGSVTAPLASAVTTGSITVSASSADAGSGVASAQFQFAVHGASTWTNIGAAVTAAPYQTTWDTAPVAEGLYDLRVVTLDRAGGSTTSATIANVRVDRTAPTGAITAPLAGANVRSTVTVSATAADTGGVAKVQFQYAPTGTTVWSTLNAADTTSPYATSWKTTAVTGAVYDIRAVVTDKAGLQTTTAVVAGILVDNTAPTASIAIANAVNAAKVGTVVYVRSATGATFNLVATLADAGSGPAKATFPVLTTAGWTHAAEVVSTPPGGPYTSATFTAAAGATSPGTYAVAVADVAGNAANSSVTLSVDATAPTGSVTVPATGANIRGAATVTSSSADVGSGVASAQIQSSPAGAGTWTTIGAPITTTPFTTTWATTAIADGLYDLRVITTDRVGYTTTSATVANVRVDNTAPTAALTAPAADAILAGASVALSATATDTGSAVANVQFQYTVRGGTTWANIGSADTTAPYTATWNTTAVADGLYDLRAVSTDKAGNTNQSSTVAVQIKNTAGLAATARSSTIEDETATTTSASVDVTASDITPLAEPTATTPSPPPPTSPASPTGPATPNDAPAPPLRATTPFDVPSITIAPPTWPADGPSSETCGEPPRDNTTPETTTSA